jgi:hypothetical protein
MRRIFSTHMFISFIYNYAVKISHETVAWHLLINSRATHSRIHELVNA